MSICNKMGNEEYAATVDTSPLMHLSTPYGEVTGPAIAIQYLKELQTSDIDGALAQAQETAE